MTDLRIQAHLSDTEVEAALRLVRTATDEDGISPLSEHVLLHLRYGGDPLARSFLLYRDGELAGYAHLDPTDPVQGPSAELVVQPGLRRHGLGLELLRAVEAEATGGGGSRPVAALGARGPARGGQAGPAGGLRADQGSVADAPVTADEDRPAAIRRRRRRSGRSFLARTRTRGPR